MKGRSERDYYLESAKKAKAVARIRAFAYGLMSSHVHWALQAIDDPLSKFLHPLHTRFGQWWNRTHGGLGKIIADRPRSILVNKSEQLALLIAYIHNNPVRAGIVSNPLESTWTSHRYYVGEEAAPEWLAVEWALAAMGYSSTSSGRLSFHEFVRARALLPRDPILAGPGQVHPTCMADLLHAISTITSVKQSNIVRYQSIASTSEQMKSAKARSTLLHIGKNVFGLSASRIGTDLGLSRQMVSKILKQHRAPSDKLISQIIQQYLQFASRSDKVR